MATSALERLIALSATPAPLPETAGPADELLLAAIALTDQLHVLLADTDDDDDDDSDSDSGGKGGGADDDDDDSDDDDGQMAKMVQQLVAKGVPKPRAVMMAKKAMQKKVAAAALCEGVAVALSHLATPSGQTVSDVRGRIRTAATAWHPHYVGLSRSTVKDEQTVRLAVLTTEERKKPSAHTIKGSTDFPIPDKGHLSAAIARYKQGALAGHSKEEVAAHIRHHAKRLNVDVAESMGK